MEIWQTGADMIYFIVRVGKHIHKLRNNLGWGWDIANNPYRTLVVFDSSLR